MKGLSRLPTLPLALLISTFVIKSTSSPLPPNDADNHAALVKQYESYNNIFPPLPEDDADLVLGDYYSYASIVDYMNKTSSKYANCHLVTVGVSEQGRAIFGIQIGSSPRNKFAVIDGGIHAREWTAVHVAIYFIDKFTVKPDPSILSRLQSWNIVIIPVLNPDGYEYTREEAEPGALYKHRLWRKNRHNTSANCEGVDLNRNWGYKFSHLEQHATYCSNTFAGDRPFSESETRTYSAWLKTVSKLSLYMTLHSHGQLWLYPYAYAPDTYTDHIRKTVYVAQKAVDEIEKLSGVRYTHGTPANLLYESSGSSMDWVQANLNPDYVFAVEVRPSTDDQNGFILEKSQLIPASQEVFIGLKTIMETADKLEGKLFTSDGPLVHLRSDKHRMRPVEPPTTHISASKDDDAHRERSEWETWIDNLFQKA